MFNSFTRWCILVHMFFCVQSKHARATLTDQIISKGHWGCGVFCGGQQDKREPRNLWGPAQEEGCSYQWYSIIIEGGGDIVFLVKGSIKLLFHLHEHMCYFSHGKSALNLTWKCFLTLYLRHICLSIAYQSRPSPVSERVQCLQGRLINEVNHSGKPVVKGMYIKVLHSSGNSLGITPLGYPQKQYVAAIQLAHQNYDEHAIQPIKQTVQHVARFRAGKLHSQLLMLVPSAMPYVSTIILVAWL